MRENINDNFVYLIIIYQCKQFNSFIHLLNNIERKLYCLNNNNNIFMESTKSYGNYKQIYIRMM